MGDVLDEALALMADTGPEYDAFEGRFSFANHGPMVAETLCVLGREDAVLPWVERYLPRLTPRPNLVETIAPAEWPNALGDLARASDWTAFFDRELAEIGWRDTLERWIPRLAAGTYGGVHGAIRTAHAVRSLGHVETELRVHELAEGLAYWAATFATLPDTPGPSAGLLPSEALATMEQLDLADRTGWVRFTDPIDKLQHLPSFATVADRVDLSDPSKTLSDLSEACAAMLITNVTTVNPRALCHALTGGTATRMMLPYLSPETTALSLRYGWQLAAAFYAACVLEPPARIDAPSESIDQLIDEALACPDEHGIKVLETCLREHQLNPNPAYLAAARATTRRLNDVGLNLYT
jgi:hypothetical protein